MSYYPLGYFSVEYFAPDYFDTAYGALPLPDVPETVISQYADSPVILSLIQSFDDAVNPSKNIDAFVEYVWDIDTAQGYGLDVWGRIVDVSRQLTISGGGSYFGFSDDGLGDFTPFGQAPFYNGVPVTSNYTLGEPAFKTLILVKAAANLAATTAPQLNQLLQTLFAGRGRAYSNDLGNMQMRYTFEFYLQPYELAILTTSGALPSTTGVGVSVLQAPMGAMFNFSEAGP